MTPSPTARTVLLVEDDAAVRELAAELLRALGHAVIEAGDALEALAKLEQDRSIDLLFSDIVMPHGVSGIQLVEKARHIRPELPVILTSGYPRGSLGERGEPLAETPLLRKPYTLEQLRLMIDTLMGSTRAGAPVAPEALQPD